MQLPSLNGVAPNAPQPTPVSLTMDPRSFAPEETLSVGTPTNRTAAQLATDVNSAYVCPFSSPTGAPLVRGLYSATEGATVVVSTPYQASQTITLHACTWWVQTGFTALRAGGTITDLVVGF
jgi:hypothetical protein